MRERQESMYVYVRGRRWGKTTKTIEWVEQGKRVPHYPFWDRVIVTPTREEAIRLRDMLSKRALERGDADPQGLQYNRVYYAEEWQRAYVGRDWQGEIALDNAEWLFTQMFRQTPSLVTMTGRLLPDSVPATLPEWNKEEECDCTWTRCSSCPYGDDVPCACAGGPCGKCGG